MNEFETKNLVGYPEAARMLGIPLGTLYNWVAERRIPHIRFSERLVRFDRVELQAWIEARVVPVAEE